MQAATTTMPPERAGALTPLVLLPGTLCDERLFAPLLARLAPRATIVLPLAGTDAVGAAARVLAHAPAQFALLGFSLGGILALEVAAQAAARVAGLALVGANARAMPPDPDDTRLAAWRATGPIGAHVRERLWPSYVGAAACGNLTLRDEVAAMADAVGAERLAGQLGLMRTRRDSRSRLPGYHHPALVLAGAEDALCPPHLQRELAAGLPDATLAFVIGAGHFVLMEAPDAAAAHVAAWLARVDEGAAAARPCYTPIPDQERS